MINTPWHFFFENLKRTIDHSHCHDGESHYYGYDQKCVHHIDVSSLPVDFKTNSISSSRGCCLLSLFPSKSVSLIQIEVSRCGIGLRTVSTDHEWFRGAGISYVGTL